MNTQQLSLFPAEPPITEPHTLQEVLTLWKTFIMREDNDPDAFTWDEIANGYSFSFYGIKAFELRKKKKGTGLAVRGRLKATLLNTAVAEGKEDSFYALPALSAEQMKKLIQMLIAEKESAFFESGTESFACCNDFIRCSNEMRCLHPKDRFYIKCEYRKNLEKGRIFYGRNREVCNK